MARTNFYQLVFPFTALGLLSSTLIVCIDRVGGIAAHGLLVPVVIFLWSMSIITYARLWCLSPGYVEHQQETAEVCLVEASSGEPRHCKKCDVVKPDRAHHCSRCNRCILKMDHHCPWIGGCVGEENQRLFLIFLGYTATYAAMNLASLCTIRRNDLVICWQMYKLYWYTLFCIIRNFYQMIQERHYVSILTGVYGWSQIDIPFVLTLMQGLLFSVVLCCFTGFHLFLILSNRTTIEHYGNRPYGIRITKQGDESDPDAKIINIQGRHLPYSRGMVQNWLIVMGPNPIYWFVPIHRNPLQNKHHDQAAWFRQAIRERIGKAM